MQRRPSSEAHDLIHCSEFNDANADFQGNRVSVKSGCPSAPSSPKLRIFKTLARPFLSRRTSGNSSSSGSTPQQMTPLAMATTMAVPSFVNITEGHVVANFLEPVPTLALPKPRPSSSSTGARSLFDVDVAASSSEQQHTDTSSQVLPRQSQDSSFAFQGGSGRATPLQSDSLTPPTFLHGRRSRSTPRPLPGTLRPLDLHSDACSSISRLSLDPPLPSPKFRQSGPGLGRALSHDFPARRPPLVSRFSDWTTSGSSRSNTNADRRETLASFPVDLPTRPTNAGQGWSSPSIRSVMNKSFQDADDEGGRTTGSSSEESRPSKLLRGRMLMATRHQVPDIDVSTQTPAFSPVVMVAPFQRLEIAPLTRLEACDPKDTSPDRQQPSLSEVSNKVGEMNVTSSRHAHHRHHTHKSSVMTFSDATQTDLTSTTRTASSSNVQSRTPETSLTGMSREVGSQDWSPPSMPDSQHAKTVSDEVLQRDVGGPARADDNLLEFVSGWRQQGLPFLNTREHEAMPSFDGQGGFIDRRESEGWQLQARARRAIKRRSC
ncbi:hypothetical protein OIO90_000358 [Microbotryomycetes sp. JL221]|nr:hypothetical protein OIO90_000358 [Microbotryomycetes sp. JL221]